MIYSQLPPLNSVKAFDAVVRHGSISEASRVLCVSQSAVSRHVAKLEAFLGSKLLRRSKLGTVTTKEGQEFFDQISHSLNEMAAVTTKIRAAHSGINIVKVSSLSSFALRWLVPRLSRFQSKHPEIVLDISISDTRPDFEDSQIDCAIISESEHSNTKSTAKHIAKNDHVLFVEELVVIASPSLFEGEPPKAIDEIRKLPFIHTSTRSELWNTWQNEAGIDNNDQSLIGLSFQDFYISIAACIAGSGIAMVPLFLVREELESGVLIQLLDSVINPDRRYQLVIPAFKSTNPSVLALQEWLLNETKTERVNDC
jgi:LysR family glycine cleavage system transcriptional activator